jgi:transcriptional regulator with XRE-family HTH domain
MSQKAISFGGYVRRRREELKARDPAFSVRQVAGRAGIEPAYLSKIERDEMPPPGEETICKLADELDEDADVLLAMAGKVSSDLRAIIMRRPRLFADLIRQLKNTPDHAILRVVRQVNNGTW